MSPGRDMQAPVDRPEVDERLGQEEVDPGPELRRPDPLDLDKGIAEGRGLNLRNGRALGLNRQKEA